MATFKATWNEEIDDFYDTLSVAILLGTANKHTNWYKNNTCNLCFDFQPQLDKHIWSSFAFNWHTFFFFFWEEPPIGKNIYFIYRQNTININLDIKKIIIQEVSGFAYSIFELFANDLC